MATAVSDEGFDRDGYLEGLDRLPLPSPERVVRTFLEIVRE